MDDINVYVLLAHKILITFNSAKPEGRKQELNIYFYVKCYFLKLCSLLPDSYYV